MQCHLHGYDGPRLEDLQEPPVCRSLLLLLRLLVPWSSS
jgi:hypothetical protein